MAERVPTSFRLSEECRRLIRELAEQLGVKDAAVIELAIRRMAQAESQLPPAKAATPPAAGRKAPGKPRPRKPQDRPA